MLGRHLLSVTILLLCSIFSLSYVSAAGKPDYAILYEQHLPSVVTINTVAVDPLTGGSQGGLGSGILVEDNQILTAAHVVNTATIINVKFHDGETISAIVLSSIENSDVALLKLTKAPSNAKVAILADSDKTKIGEPVFIIGAPFGISQTLSIGHLSGRMQRGLMAGGTPIEFLQTDTAINTGNSGGPMFNQHGEVIGIVSFILSKSGGFDGIGFASSSNTAKQALLNSSGLLAGFEGVFLNETMAAVLNIPEPGILIQRVVEGSIAQRAGLRSGRIPAVIAGQSLKLGGDTILAINDLICATPHDVALLREQSQSFDQGQPYSIRVFREGKVVVLFTEVEDQLLPTLSD